MKSKTLLGAFLPRAALKLLHFYSFIFRLFVPTLLPRVQAAQCVVTLHKVNKQKMSKRKKQRLGTSTSWQDPERSRMSERRFYEVSMSSGICLYRCDQPREGEKDRGERWWMEEDDRTVNKPSRGSMLVLHVCERTRVKITACACSGE